MEPGWFYAVAQCAASTTGGKAQGAQMFKEWQARSAQVRARAAGLPGHDEEISGANHYTILNDMLRPEGRIHQAVAMMVGIRPSVSTPPETR